jgi:hypothetical protein
MDLHSCSTSYRRASPLLRVSALAALLVTQPASALYEDDEGQLVVDGSYRNTTAVVDNYDSPLFQLTAPPGGGPDRADGLSYSSLRLTAHGYPADWFSYELHAVQDVSLFTSAAAVGGFAFSSPPDTRYRLVSGGWSWAQGEDVEARLWIDRAWVRYQLPGFDLTLGRQAVTFGKAHFWSPLDVFLPFDSRQFDREYKRGVDAVRADVPLGDLSGVNVVATPGRVDQSRVYERSWYGSALLGRAYTNVLDWDLALQGGKIYGGYQMGGALAGELGPIELRAEAAYFAALDESREPLSLPNHWTGVFGLGRLFDSSLNLQAEYLYNGAGDDADLFAALQRVMAGRAFQLSEHLVGALVSYDLLPILNGQLAAITSLSDGSGIIQPGLCYSIADESDVLAGALIAYGRRPGLTAALQPELRSEFGTYPNFYYVQYRFYF